MLLIYLPIVSPRSEYIFELIFKNELGVEFQVTTESHAFDNYQQEKINYSYSRRSDEFFIKASPLLFENFIKKIDPLVAEKYQTKVLFPNDTSCDVGFDIFAAVFFMVTRYEEYLPFTPDAHGGFNAIETLAFKNNFLQTPVVDIWIKLFKEILQKKFRGIKLLPSRFKAILTYDIDVAYKFKGRSFKRVAGGTIKDLVNLNFKNIYSRIRTLTNMQKDPWYAYDYLQETIMRNKLDSIFFFLLGDFSLHDRNLNYKNLLIKHLIHTIKAFSKIGIHPSYVTTSFPEKISTEKKRLENLSGQKIIKSRQHFLRFILPETYNSLIAAGITEDYSMGFSDLPGFRAGTCKPFYFYDLKKENSTSLKIFPITLMEGTFIDSKVSQPFQEMLNLIKEVKDVNGTFISIWHNHTVSETKEFAGWRKIHDQMIEFITQILKTEPSE